MTARRHPTAVPDPHPLNGPPNQSHVTDSTAEPSIGNIPTTELSGSETRPPTPTQLPPTGRRLMVVIGLLLFTIAALAGLLAEQGLAGQDGPWLGPVQLRLIYNSGVAFSLGSTLPAWAITAVTGALTLAIGIFAWRTAPSTPTVGRVGLAAIIAGALGNFTDRAIDGVVTDYLHTGWFPTFNLPDVYITGGAVLLIAATLTPAPTTSSNQGTAEPTR